MGTNYYVILNHCSECGREDELHIGKSSRGNPFILHVYPHGRKEYPTGALRNWAEWQEFFSNPCNYYEIMDEYGQPVTIADLNKLVLNNEWGVTHCANDFC